MNTSPRATQEPGGLSLPLPLPTHPGRPRKGTLHAVENSGALKTLGEILLGHSAARSDNLLDRRRQNGAALAPPATFDLNRLGFRRPVLKLVTPANLTANGSADDDLEPISPLGPTRPQFIRRRVRTTDLNSPDLPPSPVGFPGAWNYDGDEESKRNGALLLPPPFLDEGSSRESFEGLLGTRTARESDRKARREARQYAKDRLPPTSFPQNLFPQSLLATASKLISSLGPPGGLDSGPLYRSWKQNSDADGLGVTVRRERKRTERAERGLKGFAFGEAIAAKMAERLRREQRDHTKLESGPAGVLQQEEATIRSVRAATPMSMFGPSSTEEQLSPDSSFSSFSPFKSDVPPFINPFSVNTTPSPALVPSKPKLGPVTDPDIPLSPFPITPTDEGYFNLEQRRCSSFFSQPTAPIILLSGEALHPTSATANRVYSIVGAPIQFAFKIMQERTRKHLDLIIWVLIGTLDDDATFDNPGGLIGFISHLFGFTFYLLVHSWACATSAFATIKSISLFLHWTYLNLTGQTDLSRVARQYIKLCQHELATVYREDSVSLGVTNVLMSMLEMAAIQAMSKQRYIAEGPGNLRLLNDSREEMERGGTLSRRSSVRGERVGLVRRRTGRRGSTIDDGEEGNILVTRGEDQILEGSILRKGYDPTSPKGFDSPSGMAPLDMDDLPPLDLSVPGFSFSPKMNPFRDSRRISVPSSPPLRPVPLIKSRPFPTLLKTLKRHAKLSTASYGLHSYILAPPTPMFTPSGATLHHTIFSHLAGIEDAVLHVAIQKNYLDANSDDVDVDSYSPQYYLIRDDINSEVLCVIRGTQSLSDVRTDLEAAVVEIELPSLTVEGEMVKYKIHAGILAAAKGLLRPESLLFGKLLKSLEEHDDYGLVFTGHSLGAAIASTVALLISSFSASKTWQINTTCGLPPNRPIRALSFAHPTTVDIALSRRCSLGEIPLVLSISLGSDVVVRMGIPQVRNVRRALGRLAKQRRKFLQSRKEGERGQTSILRSWWEWKKLGGGATTEEGGEKGGLSEAVREIEERGWKWRQEMDGFGEFVAAETEEKEGDFMLIPCGKALHLDRLPAELEARRRAALEQGRGDEEEDGDEEDDLLFGLYEVGNPAAFFSMPFLEADLVKSHLPRHYLDAVESL